MKTKPHLLVLLFVVFFVKNLAQQTCNLPKITDDLGNENPVVDCNYPLTGKCLNLNATFPKFYETSSYSVTSENYSPYGTYNSGTALNANADDLFIKKIVLPFNFCFFGNSFSEIVVGTNGIVTFESSQLGNINYPNIQNQNPNISLPKNSIFGVMQDLIFSDQDDSEIYYSTIGTAPCRKFIINFYKGRVVGCDQTSTSQIVLSEGSNEIEVFSDEKEIPCAEAKFKESLIGIIDGNGNLGYSPPNRNTGIWSANKEAWKFTPSGNEILPQISWLNSSNQIIGNGPKITVCPTKNEIYRVNANYATCANSNFVLQQQTSVSFAPDFPLADDLTKIFCTSTNINLDTFQPEITPQNPANLIFTFHNSLAEAQNNQNPQPKNFVLNNNKTFFVRVQNPSNLNCFRTSVLNLNLIANSLISNKVEICDVNNDGIENNYQLSLLIPKLFLPSQNTVSFFNSSADATGNTNEITYANITKGSQFYVRYKTPDCSEIFGPITINFLPSPNLNSPLDFPFTICDFKNDNTEPFDFALTIGPLISTDPNLVFTFYNTYNEAFAGVGSKLNSIKEGQYVVYARAEIPGGCFSIATVNLDITFTKVVANDNTVYLCFDGSQDVDVNLDDYTQNMLIDPLVGITKTYYLTENDAVLDVSPISNLQTLTGNGDFVSNVFYVKFLDNSGCYALQKLTINLVHVVIFQSQFNVCDFKNDGVENAVLSNFNANIVGTQNASVTYFVSQDDATNNVNPITNFNVNNTAKLYVRISSFNCIGIFEINLNLVPTPVVNPNISVIRNSVCDNNNDGQENFDLTSLQPQIYNGSDKVVFEYYTGFDPLTNLFSGLIFSPQTYAVAGSSTVYAKIIFVNGGCYSSSKIDIKLNFLPPIILKSGNLAKCDFDFNLNESFTLEDALPQVFIQNDNSISLSDLTINFFASQTDANSGDLSIEIFSPFIISTSSETVYVRFTSKTTFCYSVAPVFLKIYLPPKALNSTIADICDENLDGSYDVDLTAFTANMVTQISVDNNFSFYYSKTEAQNLLNPILNPEKFNINNLPQTLWVRVENIPGCFDVASVDLVAGSKITLNNAGPFQINVCDLGNDSIENLDLTHFESTIYSGTATFDYFLTLSDLNNFTNKITNPQNYLFNETTGNNKIFIKISATGFCPEMVEIDLSLKKTPIFLLPDYYFCPDGFVDIQPDFTGLNISSFEWLDSSGKIVSTNNELLNINTEGTYQINVTAQNGCTFSTKFEVIKYEVPIITQLIAEGNSITIIATGSKTILYSKDGITFQTSNVFENLPAGITTFYVKFVDSDCLGLTKSGLILNINNAFSPNGDGINDTWFIDDLNVFDGQKAILKVFDRFQKLVFQQESNLRLEWNGMSNRHKISTDSYWYIITLPDGRIFTGWVLLKNRN
ncbi:T9SS type B sorting domain-containing protein [Halpernia frigidisoli]|uniref:Gliding motility-associated C-terminal domain-containing protein n=1 Tax=Halpernia frigidisoli TaxID=1125876 RepID=A0A1I3FKN7_9FLAO|nr:T9SS type B sorting domain-containing protein [Halpernia frigidisoli]SFI11481.1 gliding motility-associated C-terminal domain-containing protein [Halpernia frigidisoli]